jgi:hypothetical protein
MSSPLDNIAYELAMMRKESNSQEIYVTLEDDTETSIQKLASHFAGNHERCDHPRERPVSPQEVVKQLEAWGWYLDGTTWRLIT